MSHQQSSRPRMMHPCHGYHPLASLASVLTPIFPHKAHCSSHSQCPHTRRSFLFRTHRHPSRGIQKLGFSHLELTRHWYWPGNLSLLVFSKQYCFRLRCVDSLSILSIYVWCSRPSTGPLRAWKQGIHRCTYAQVAELLIPTGLIVRTKPGRGSLAPPPKKNDV